MAQCSMCKKEIATDEARFPFCSERCRLLDLGNWLDERYTVPSGHDDAAAGDELPEGRRPS